MKQPPLFAFLMAVYLLPFISVNVCADIYLYIDKKGNPHFSEHKKNDKYRLLLRSDSNQKKGTFKDWKEKIYTNIYMPYNKKLQDKYHAIIVQEAQRNQLESAFVHAVISAESAYKAKAISRTGAKGLMQLMPETAKRFQVKNPFNAQKNIAAGTRYLKILLDEFKTKELALAAYNAGEGTVRRYKNKIPPYPETQKYVKKVLKLYHNYKKHL